MAKIQLIARGYEKATGLYFNVQFVDGISVSDVDANAVGRIGSAISIKILEGEDTRAAQMLIDNKSLSIPPKIKKNVEEKPATTEVEKTEAVTKPEVKIYTRDELVKTVETKGITGLRLLAEPLGVKGRQVNRMIDAILDAQKEISASTEETQASE